MDLNWLLSLVVLVSTLSIVVRARGAAFKSTRQLAAALAALDVAGMVYAPEYGGYVVGGLWALTFLVPGLLNRSVQHAALGQQYARAERLLFWVGLLRPSSGIR